jgi:two-component system osmolarity sensor histidine kinase EnvZ
LLDGKGDPALKAGLIQDVADIDAAIGQFLDFARLAEGETAVPEGDLNAMVREVCDRFTRAGKAVSTRLNALPPLALRPSAVQRLISNLVDNALRHGGPEVEVTTRRENGRAVIEVLDRGPGIPQEESENMLQPFTRLDRARSTSGSGLGLAIVDRIARLHGGSVRLLAREGGGLRARVELPLEAGKR